MKPNSIPVYCLPPAPDQQPDAGAQLPDLSRVTPLLLALAILAAPAFAYPNGYSYCKVVTTKANMVSGTSDLANYPLSVVVTDADLKTTGNGGLVNNASGFDIGFYPDCSGSGTALKWEIESYNPATGALVAHVLRPALSHTADDTIGLYYGGAFSTLQSAPALVWNSSYRLVQHFPDGANLSANDSTSNANNAVSTGVTAAAGKVGGAASFATNQYLTVTNSASFQIERTDTAAWECWIKPVSYPSYPMIAQQMNGGPDYRGWQFWIDSSTGKAAATMFNDNGANKQISRGSSSVIPLNVWTHVAITFDGSSASNGFNVYVNGVLDNAASDGATISATTVAAQDMSIGRRRSSNNLFWNGALDELRITKGALRSADWILTEYRNQSAPATYMTLGPRMTGSAPTQVRHGVRYIGF